MNGLMFARILCGERGADALKASRSTIQSRCSIFFFFQLSCGVPIYFKVFFICVCVYTNQVVLNFAAIPFGNSQFWPKSNSHCSLLLKVRCVFPHIYRPPLVNGFQNKLEMRLSNNPWMSWLFPPDVYHLLVGGCEDVIPGHHGEAQSAWLQGGVEFAVWWIVPPSPFNYRVLLSLGLFFAAFKSWMKHIFKFERDIVNCGSPGNRHASLDRPHAMCVCVCVFIVWLKKIKIICVALTQMPVTLNLLLKLVSVIIGYQKSRKATGVSPDWLVSVYFSLLIGRWSHRWVRLFFPFSTLSRDWTPETPSWVAALIR